MASLGIETGLPFCSARSSLHLKPNTPSELKADASSTDEALVPFYSIANSRSPIRISERHVFADPCGFGTVDQVTGNDQVLEAHPR